MSAYLEEHLPLLRSLHASLGLPSTSLQEDETRIDAAIKAVVVSIVKERETEVENWKEAISVAKRDVACIARALGEKPAGKLEDENEVSRRLCLWSWRSLTILALAETAREARTRKRAARGSLHGATSEDRRCVQIALKNSKTQLIVQNCRQP